MAVEPNIHGALPERLGFRITEVAVGGEVAASDAVARGELTVDPELLHGGGDLHGGVLFTFADSVAAELVVRAAPGHRATTTDASIRFLRRVDAGRLYATGRVVHRGRRSRVVEVRIEDADSQLVALYGANFIELARDAADGVQAT